MTDEKDMNPSADESAKQDASSPSGESSSASTPDGTESADVQQQVDAAGESSAADVAQDEPGSEESPVDDLMQAAADGKISEEDAEAAMLEMLKDLPQDESGASPDDIDFGSGEVSKAEFQQLSQAASTSPARNIDLLMDVDLPVSIELGRTKLTISDILSLGPGSVVELNKLAGEPVDLMVNSKIVARGEVVVVDENFGLRITQLMTPEERLKLLGKE